jgi:hypothetical protein
VIALVVIAVLTPASPAGDAPSAAQRFRDLRGALVLVGHGVSMPEGVAISWLGTGFVADVRCTLVTAQHILEGVDPAALVVRLRDPESPADTVTTTATLAHRDPDRDLAYLRMAGTPEGLRCRGPVGPIPIAGVIDGAALAGEPVLIAGFPAIEGEEPRDVPVLRRGSIASGEFLWSGRPMLLLDLTGIPGFSGAPVVLESTGEVVGVVFGTGRTPREYGTTWATPLVRDDLPSRPGGRR